MASFGNVFKFISNKVVVHDPKPKYHIAIELAKEGHFLFISSNAFEGAMAITRTDWPEMPKQESFVSFSRIVSYQLKDLKGVSIDPCGRLTDQCIHRLRAHAVDSLVLEKWEIELIVSTIDALEG